MAVQIDYTDKISVKNLGNILKSLDEPISRTVLAKVLANGLFIIMGPDGRPAFQAALEGIPTGVREIAYMAMLTEQAHHLPTSALMDAFIDHVVNGQDQYDLASAGGLSGDEMVKLVGFLSTAGFDVTVGVPTASPLPTGVQESQVIAGFARGDDDVSDTGPRFN
jgi:hypothetical protein